MSVTATAAATAAAAAAASAASSSSDSAVELPRILPAASSSATSSSASSASAAAAAESQRPLWILRHIHDTPLERCTLRWFLKHGMTFQDLWFEGVFLHLVVTTAENGPMSEELLEVLESGRRLERVASVHHVRNQGLDWGAWSQALDVITPDPRAAVILMNSTIAGPVFPPWTDPLVSNWPQAFVRRLNEETALVGISINPRMGLPHVQSMLLCMTGSLLGELRSKTPLFNSKELATKGKREVVLEHEVALSLYVITELGKNVACLIPEFEGVDWRKPETWPKLLPNMHRSQDPCFFRSCYGRTLHPYETLFFKVNRDLHREPFMKLIYSRLGLAWPPK